MTDLIKRLHDCKRGLSTATPDDYNKWWREMTRLKAVVDAARRYRNSRSYPNGADLDNAIDRLDHDKEST